MNSLEHLSQGAETFINQTDRNRLFSEIIRQMGRFLSQSIANNIVENVAQEKCP